MGIFDPSIKYGKTVTFPLRLSMVAMSEPRINGSDHSSNHLIWPSQFLQATEPPLGFVEVSCLGRNEARGRSYGRPKRRVARGGVILQRAVDIQEKRGWKLLSVLNQVSA